MNIIWIVSTLMLLRIVLTIYRTLSKVSSRPLPYPSMTFSPMENNLKIIFLLAHGPSGDRGRLLPTLPVVPTVEDQDVVPPTLLKHYLSMADVELDGSPVENEIPAFCAYTFPAVVITLGSANWPVLRECFEKLAIMFQVNLPP